MNTFADRRICDPSFLVSLKSKVQAELNVGLGVELIQPILDTFILPISISADRFKVLDRTRETARTPAGHIYRRLCADDY